jgi:apolipoprotein N-acyltransferase
MNTFKAVFWNKKWSLSLAIGLMLGLSFPPFPFPFLVFPAFVLLFRLIDLSATPRQAAFYCYPGFVLWNLIATYWLMLANVVAGVAAILANAAVMTLPVMLQFQAQKKLTNVWLIALLQTAFWISFEFLHHHWDLAWPWLALGNAWAGVPELVQYISATGYLGISFWIVIVSSLAYQALKWSYRPAGYATLVLAVAFPVISLLQLTVLELPVTSTVETVVAQPNFDSYEEYGGYDTPQQAMKSLIALSDSARTDSTELIVWPENGIHPALYSHPVENQSANRIKDMLVSAVSRWGVTIIGGATYIQYFQPEEAPALSRGTDENPWLYYNSALAFYPDSTIEVYRKHNLVPIVERMPFIHFLDAIDLMDWVDWKDIQGYGKGKNSEPFPVDSTYTPALVCYDSVFPSWTRDFIINGAGFITIITNDGWWGETSGHAQHFAFARLRAVEFRRWIVRSANNGISGIIAPDGEVKIQTPYWERTAFSYEVPVITTHTLYARFGDWLPYGTLIVSVVGLAAILIKTRKTKEQVEQDAETLHTT